MNEIKINLTDEQVAAIIKQWFVDNVHREGKYRDNEAGRIIKHFITEDGNWKNKPRGKLTNNISNSPGNTLNKTTLDSKTLLKNLISGPSTTEL